MLKGILLFVFGLVAYLHTTFVLTLLWNWFVVPAFRAANISFWMMYGLVLAISLLKDSGDTQFEDERRWKAVMSAIDTCVPEDRRQELQQELQDQKSEVWTDAGILIFSRALVTTVTLGIGFLVHIFVSI